MCRGSGGGPTCRTSTDGGRRCRPDPHAEARMMCDGSSSLDVRWTLEFWLFVFRPGTDWLAPGRVGRGPVVDDREVFFAEGFLFLGVEDRWPEELLGDQGRHEGRQDD